MCRTCGGSKSPFAAFFHMWQHVMHWIFVGTCLNYVFIDIKSSLVLVVYKFLDISHAIKYVERDKNRIERSDRWHT